MHANPTPTGLEAGAHRSRLRPSDWIWAGAVVVAAAFGEWFAIQRFAPKDPMWLRIYVLFAVPLIGVVAVVSFLKRRRGQEYRRRTIPTHRRILAPLYVVMTLSCGFEAVGSFSRSDLTGAVACALMAAVFGLGAFAQISGRLKRR